MSESTRDIWEHVREYNGDYSAAWLSYDEALERYAYVLPENALTFDSLADVRKALRDAGSHYYDADAIRFFRGRTHSATVGHELAGGRFWVESKQFEALDGTRDARTYSVAWISRYNDSLSVEKLGEFGNLPQARGWAKRLSEALENNERQAS